MLERCAKITGYKMYGIYANHMVVFGTFAGRVAADHIRTWRGFRAEDDAVLSESQRWAKMVHQMRQTAHVQVKPLYLIATGSLKCESPGWRANLSHF